MRRQMRLLAVTTAFVLAGSAAAPVGSAQSPRPTAAAPQATLTQAVEAAIAQRAATLAGDPAAVLAYVAGTIAPVDYPGALQGARGATLTGIGNSIDRALLAAELLRSADPALPIRFASCAVAESGGTPDVTPPKLAIDDADTLVSGVTDPDTRDAITSLAAYRGRMQQRTAAAATDLGAVLGSGDHPWQAVAVPPAPAPDHVWLQVMRDGAWTDLDPASPTGSAPCAADSTSPDLPEALADRLTIRLAIERQREGAVVEQTALEVTRPTADLSTARITFGFGEPMGLVPRVDAGDGMLRYTPLLRIDDESVLGEPFDIVQPIAPDAGGGFGDFSGLDPFGGGGEPPTETDPVTAAWLDLTLTQADGSTRSARAEVFDRIGPEARAAGTAGSALVQPLDLVGGVVYSAPAATWHIGLLTGVPGITDAEAPIAFDQASLDTTTVDGLAGSLDAMLRLYPALRRDLGGSADVPMVLLAGVSQVAGPSGAPGDILTRLVLDAPLVPATPPVDTRAAAADAQATLAAERMLLTLAGGEPGTLGDAMAVFEAATQAGTPWLVITPETSTRPTGASGTALARMASRLAAGATLLTPAVAPTVDGTPVTAWWSIDPATGIVRDEHESGRHQGMTEYGGEEAEAESSAWNSFCQFAWGLRRPFVIAAAALFLGTGGQAGGEALKGVVKIVEAQAAQRKTADEAMRLACGPKSGVGPPLP